MQVAARWVFGRSWANSEQCLNVLGVSTPDADTSRRPGLDLELRVGARCGTTPSDQADMAISRMKRKWRHATLLFSKISV